jgi:hypothetical protein
VRKTARTFENPPVPGMPRIIRPDPGTATWSLAVSSTTTLGVPPPAAPPTTPPPVIIDPLPPGGNE